MAFDYKKEYKEYYMPKNTPQIVQVTKMNFLAVRGVGDPNEKGGAYQDAIGLLYGIAFTIKMSKKGSHKIDGYFDKRRFSMGNRRGGKKEKAGLFKSGVSDHRRRAVRTVYAYRSF